MKRYQLLMSSDLDAEDEREAFGESAHIADAAGFDTYKIIDTDTGVTLYEQVDGEEQPCNG